MPARIELDAERFEQLFFRIVRQLERVDERPWLLECLHPCARQVESDRDDGATQEEVE